MVDNVVRIVAVVLGLGVTAPSLAFSEGNAATQPVAEEKKSATWKVGASVRPRAELRTNHHFGLDDGIPHRFRDSEDRFSIRSRFHVQRDGEKLELKLQFQHAAQFGTGGDELSDPQLTAHQAYMRWNVSDKVWLQFGRFELAYGDQRVLGAVGWSQVGRAWDGVRTRFKLSDHVRADLFATVYQEGLFDAFERDGYLVGTYWHLFELLEYLPELDLYFLADFQTELADADVTFRRQLNTAGARLKTAFDPGSFVIEGAYQFGETCNAFADPSDNESLCQDTASVRAWFFDAEGKVGVDAGVPLDLFIGFGIASGDDPETDNNEAYFHNYPTAHKFLGLTDIIGARTNVMEARGGFALNLGYFRLRESFHSFWTQAPSTESRGFELDSTISVPIMDGLSADAGHGLFFPSDVAGRETSGLANWFYLQITGSFDTKL